MLVCAGTWKSLTYQEPFPAFSKYAAPAHPDGDGRGVVMVLVGGSRARTRH
jgi:hypothetical protein